MQKQKLSSDKLIAINTLMLQTIASYVTVYVSNEDSVSSLQMYADDVAHNVTALQNFNKTHDVLKLHDTILAQDTLVREYFYKTLKYIETNNLIDKRYFACI